MKLIKLYLENEKELELFEEKLLKENKKISSNMICENCFTYSTEDKTFLIHLKEENEEFDMF